MTEYNIFHISDEKVGCPSAIRRNIDHSTSDEIPEDAFSLPALRAAEEQRAENARRLMGSALGSLLTRENASMAQTGLGDLLRGLPSGSVAYEPVISADQLNDGVTAHAA